MARAERWMVGHLAPQTKPVIIKVLNQKDLIEIYSLQANVMLFEKHRYVAIVVNQAYSFLNLGSPKIKSKITLSCHKKKI